MNKPILVVEDNPDDVTLALEAFKKNGVSNPVVIMRDGQEALDYLLARADDGTESEPLPALALLDLNLPKIGGIEVLRRLRLDPRTRMLPVVVFTTSRERNDLRDCYLSGANSFVCKPVEFSDSVALIGRLADYWLKLNVSPPVGR
jgi:two-component system, response regulator